MRWLQVYLTPDHQEPDARQLTRLDQFRAIKRIDRQIDTLFVFDPTNCFRGYSREGGTSVLPAITYVRQIQFALGVDSRSTFIASGSPVSIAQPHDLGYRAERNADAHLAINETTRPEERNLQLAWKRLCGRECPPSYWCIRRDAINIIGLDLSWVVDDLGDPLQKMGALELWLKKNVDSSYPGIVMTCVSLDDLLRFKYRRQLQSAIARAGASPQLFVGGNGMKTESLHGVLTFCTQEGEVLEGELDKTGILARWRKWPVSSWESEKVGSHEERTESGGYRSANPSSQGAYRIVRGSQGRVAEAVSLSQMVLTREKLFRRHLRMYQSQTQHNMTVAKELRKAEESARKTYRAYLTRQCGSIELNGIPIDVDEAIDRYRLESIFVPQSLIRHDMRQVDNREGPDVRPTGEPMPLSSLVPKKGRFCVSILSEPGGGKTTLLKWLASAYIDPKGRVAKKNLLVKRSLLPIWLPCRDIAMDDENLSIMGIIRYIARTRADVDGDKGEAFVRLAQNRLKQGRLLLLVDGLDEISSSAQRRDFVKKLQKFVSKNTLANVIVTSRPTGFDLVTRGALSDFDLLEINPLDPKGVRKLCRKWFKLAQRKADATERQRRADDLADRIVGDERIFRLARNPLMLTTLLVVERRVGRLPNRRVILYRDAVQVLLDSWNRAGHVRDEVDPDAAEYQLAYVAFDMESRGVQSIGHKDLTALLERMRREYPELVETESGTVEEYVRRIEQRSGLLVQKGVARVGDAEEPVYEFQHLTFQEYLASRAVIRACYPGIEDEDSSLEVLRPRLGDMSMQEVILLCAAQGRLPPKQIARWTIEQLDGEAASHGERIQLRTLLLELLADEVPLGQELERSCFSHVFDDELRFADEETFKRILEGVHGQRMRAYLVDVDRERFGGYACLSTLPEALEQSDSWSWSWDEGASDEERTRRMSLLANRACFSRTMFSASYSVGRWQTMLDDPCPHVAWQTLRALSATNYSSWTSRITRGKGLGSFLRACVRATNAVGIPSPTMSSRMLSEHPRDEVWMTQGLSERSLEELLRLMRFELDRSALRYDHYCMWALIAHGCYADPKRLGEVADALVSFRRRVASTDSESHRLRSHVERYWLENMQRLLVLAKDIDPPHRSAAMELMLRIDREWVRGEARLVAEGHPLKRRDMYYLDHTLPAARQDESYLPLEDSKDGGEAILSYIDRRIQEVRWEE